MLLRKALYHACFICGQRWKWWSHRPKLTPSVISDIKPIIHFVVNPVIAGRPDIRWATKIKLAGCDTPFLIDTGVKYNVITLACYQNPSHSVGLHKSARVLHTFSNNYIHLLAAVRLKAEHKQVSVSIEFNIIDT